MSLGEHLRELRNRIVVSAIAIAVGTIAAFLFRHQILHFLTKPYCDQPVAKKFSTDGRCTLIVSGVLDAFTLSLKISVNVGIIAAAPVWLFQVWRFITPGLRSKERTWVVTFVFFSTALFLAGAAVAYLTLPKGLQFLLGFGGDSFTPLIQATKYISFLLAMMLVFGIAFEFPLLIVMLNLVGVVSAKKLHGWRRMEIFSVFVFAAIATPSQDPFTMTALAVPMCLMYEGAVVIARFHDRRVAGRSTETDLAGYSDDQASPLQPATPI